MLFTDLIATFANNLLPIILISGAGFTLGKLLEIEPRGFARVIFYIFSPILVFNLLIHNELPIEEIFGTVGFALTAYLIIALLALGVARLMRFEKPTAMAVLLTGLFGNTGNYGLPLVSFAFGKDALAFASLYFVTSAILFNTVGVLIASLGHMNIKEALVGLLKIPTVYAVLLAVLLNQLGVEMPELLTRTVGLASDGAIPAMLILLGLELARVQWANSLRPIGAGVFVRLGLAPLVGFLLAIPFGLQGPARQASILETAMPTAVTTTILASEYRLEPSLVTAVVFFSTLLSPLTLTPLLVYLGR